MSDSRSESARRIFVRSGASSSPGNEGERPTAVPNGSGCKAKAGSPSRSSRGKLLGAVPAVLKSFVVEFVTTEGDSEITARIQPTEQASAALTAEGFRPSEAILDLASDLLVEIAREDEGLQAGEDDP